MRRTIQEGTSVPWTRARFCVLDLETTGLDPKRDEIISFGAVPVDEGRAHPADAVHFLAKPRRPINPGSVKIHTIRDCDLQNQPPLQERLQEIRSAVEGRFLVAHSAWLDAAFLAKAFKGQPAFPRAMIDTAQLATKSMECPPLGTADISLEYASTMLNLPVHAPHTALGDAMTTAQLFLALAHRLSRNEVVSVADLHDLSRRQPLPWHQHLPPALKFGLGQ